MVHPHAPFEIRNAREVLQFGGILESWHYERILHKYIDDAQRAREWVPLRGPFFDGKLISLDLVAQREIQGEELEQRMMEEMARRGFLVETERGYFFRDEIIGRVVEYYRGDYVH